MASIVEVSFKGNRREYYTTEMDAIELSDYVIVEADRGEDLGRVTAAGAVAERKCSGCSTGCAAPVPSRRVVRRAQRDEVDRAVTLRADEPRVRRITREKVAQYNLKMKVSEAEWQFDRNKLTIFFTAERRVDFRELVRDLALLEAAEAIAAEVVARPRVAFDESDPPFPDEDIEELRPATRNIGRIDPERALAAETETRIDSVITSARDKLDAIDRMLKEDAP